MNTLDNMEYAKLRKTVAELFPLVHATSWWNESRKVRYGSSARKKVFTI